MENQFVKFKKAAVEAFKEAEHRELYGLEYQEDPETWKDSHKRVLVKFMTANKDDVSAANKQLLNALKWRKEFKPLSAAFEETHDSEFEKLGVITRAPAGRIVTWNLYGAVQNSQALFSKLDEFVRWRVGLMERGIAQLDLASEEFSQMDQVHDYMNVSFLRMDSATRQASRQVIELFQNYYPEFLTNKYFVNIPYLMMWVFKLMRVTMSKETADKFHVVANGTDLRYEIGDWVPKQYGGKAGDLQSLAVKDVSSNPAA